MGPPQIRILRQGGRELAGFHRCADGGEDVSYICCLGSNKRRELSCNATGGGNRLISAASFKYQFKSK